MRIATSNTRLRHRVRLVHASTGAPIGPLSARLTAARHGWAVRTVPDGVVVTARTDVAAPPTPPQLAVTVTDGALAQLLVFPPAPGLPPRTLLVELDTADIELPLHPVPMTLTATLVAPSTGAPRSGRTVTARATKGPGPKPEIALPEVAPGVYASAPAEWTAAFTPAELLVDGTLLRTVSMNGLSVATRIRLVDTT
ncbi:hypothetical protein [Streptomyces spongiae]|uniref:Uncharacterized protein n=1 Tax=Streptomyces spongiae TaxID=565072 RepID=A0A5N8X8D6_9ACTN|nr:hypothetical protein [Streptomyces spongiae]MPY55740.1 hypothetical protein [Streptomyces spongiae]